MRRSLFLIPVLWLGCSRAPQEPAEAPGRLELNGVTLEAWRGSRPTVSGTSPQVTVNRDDVVARDAALTFSGGARVEAAQLLSDAAGKRGAAPSGGVAKTRDGCVATTAAASRFDGASVRVDGPLTFDGCGVALKANGLTYAIPERTADLDGPVETRVEARR